MEESIAKNEPKLQRQNQTCGTVSVASEPTLNTMENHVSIICAHGQQTGTYDRSEPVSDIQCSEYNNILEVKMLEQNHHPSSVQTVVLPNNIGNKIDIVQTTSNHYEDNATQSGMEGTARINDQPPGTYARTESVSNDQTAKHNSIDKEDRTLEQNHNPSPVQTIILPNTFCNKIDDIQTASNHYQDDDTRSKDTPRIISDSICADKPCLPNSTSSDKPGEISENCLILSNPETRATDNNTTEEVDDDCNVNSQLSNNNIDLEPTIHILNVIVEESGESCDETSESLISVRTEEVSDAHSERRLSAENEASKRINQPKVPVRQFVPNIHTENKFDKCYSLEEADSLSDTSSNSMLRKIETDSDIEIADIRSDSNVGVLDETYSFTYQAEGCSTDLLHTNEIRDNSYCETSFGKSDLGSELKRCGSRRKYSRQSGERKESLEQRLKRRFTIHDEHKQEVAKRIIALVIKYSLFVFNFCSWVVAAVAIGLGLWVLTDKGHIISDGSDFFLDPTIMIVIVGGITFVVAFLGCVGALRENLLLLKVFFIVLGVIVVIELIIAITVFIMYTVPEVRERFLRSTPENILRSAIVRYMDDTDIKTWIDLIQQEFRCCGVGGLVENNEGFRDWQLNAYFNCTPSNKSIYRCAVPTSCCIFEKGDRVNLMCGFDLSDKKVVDVRDYIYTRGCILGFGEWLSKYDELIVIAALTTLIMQFLAVISAKIMIRRIVKRRRRWGRLRLRSSTSTVSS